MGKWKKQSMLMKNATDIDDRIQRLIDWASDLSDDRLRKCTISAFRTLNNPNRYKYYWQENTRTHEKYLTFLACLRELCHRKGNNLNDWCYELVNTIDMNRSKGWITLYYIIKLYRRQEALLSSYKFRFTKNDPEDVLRNARNGGYEFKDVDFYEFVDNVNRVLKSTKKNQLGHDEDEDSNRGDLVNQMYERVDKPQKVKSKKRKQVLLTEW